ncbi:MAG TPA: MBOAT family O-acyltransferase [Chitinophagales bacterium]|nr:MBOAT family O-acyltransferase [Chitinophagales bacterium]HMX60522.1 MBOAT family O-acyltransferase [Chitinophagales bacterium]HMY23001.1 MBOAT family O-acyltransferase [Chitinophagales bacterium]HMZ34176.1 MBOAT family O-acyltransferase [Chitinophagales bacterium]HNA38146.1 MBOAT family O-acyltransferase [Chitinophagales bacterium]
MLDYYTGIKIQQNSSTNRRKYWFWLSVCTNLGFLGIFKYYNFFIENFIQLFSELGIQIHATTINIILPVGISFYTFHGLSYVIDIYKNRIKAENNFIDYAVFVSFFPLLVAGPIERATHLLPQIKIKRIFEYKYANEGLRQILWGLFKKVVIADQCAQYADIVFSNSNIYSGSTLLLGAFFFTIQIYGDFSGYSDIAIGTAKLFGIDLLKNFSYPYFSRDIAEFWRRWHISLSSWFKDYLYIPLGGSKGGTYVKVRNTFIIFLVSGFWHGANWTFIIWGLLNALYIMPSIIFNTNRNNLEIVAKGRLFPTIKEFISICITFMLALFAWIFFRSDNLHVACDFIKNIFDYSLFAIPQVKDMRLLLTIAIFFSIEWIGREGSFALEYLEKRLPLLLRWIFYGILTASIVSHVGTDKQFIYFQF